MGLVCVHRISQTPHMLFGLSLSLPPIASLLSSVMTKIIRKGKGMLGELIVNIGSYNMAVNP
jgi:hypothetical protein